MNPTIDRRRSFTNKTDIKPLREIGFESRQENVARDFSFPPGMQRHQTTLSTHGKSPKGGPRGEVLREVHARGAITSSHLLKVLLVGNGSSQTKPSPELLVWELSGKRDHTTTLVTQE